MRDVLARIEEGELKEMVLASRSVRSSLEPYPAALRTQCDQVIDSLAPTLPVVATTLAEAKEEVSHLHALPRAPLANDLVDEPAQSG
ncbi:hypothetical protein [Acidimicrobium ferrooxidans]|uniref:hypothetical protein n=1 Tax=Acidimicrobium ferrooxidans TaxID=53635 RepID=UPI00019DE543|nr:hypothetical protein [Acidimicrobium ferrooxidans]